MTGSWLSGSGVERGANTWGSSEMGNNNQIDGRSSLEFLGRTGAHWCRRRWRINQKTSWVYLMSLYCAISHLHSIHLFFYVRNWLREMDSSFGTTEAGRREVQRHDGEWVSGSSSGRWVVLVCFFFSSLIARHVLLVSVLVLRFYATHLLQFAPEKLKISWQNWWGCPWRHRAWLCVVVQSQRLLDKTLKLQLRVLNLIDVSSRSLCNYLPFVVRLLQLTQHTKIDFVTAMKQRTNMTQSLLTMVIENSLENTP